MKTKICTGCGKRKKLSEFGKDKYQISALKCRCKECHKEYRDNNKEKINQKIQIYRKKYPWRRTLVDIKQRCTNPNNNNYKNYGLRGIKCLITSEELKSLWIRDKAWLLKEPSIDRKDNDGNYELSNCEFIEMIDNNKKHGYKKVIQYDLNNRFIREFESVISASKELKIDKTGISHCCRGKIHCITSGGFKWKYKNE